jgi:hypothetical protein
MTSTIEKELRAATKVSRKSGEESQTYLRRLFDKANGLDEEGWNSLSEEAQVWCNQASEAREARTDLPGFDAETEDKSESSEAAEADEQEASDKTEDKVTSKKSKKASAKKAKAPAKKAAVAAKPAKKEKAAAKSSAKASKAHTNGSGARAGSKTAQVAAMLQSSKGCTRADILKATGWPSVSVQQIAKNVGLKLTSEKEGRTLRYHAK